MAEQLEPWGQRSPDLASRPDPAHPEPLFGHSHSFGTSRDAEQVRLRLGSSPGRRPDADRSGYAKRDLAITRLLNPFGRRDRGPSTFWHRMRCRSGRHELQGGHSMQVGGRSVFVARRCRWCDTTPPR